MVKKNYIEVREHFSFEDGKVANLIVDLEPFLLRDPDARIEEEYGYDCASTYWVVWERPMTETEIATAEAKRAKDRERSRFAAARKKQKDLEDLEKQARKLGFKLQKQ